jgi:hypothetical protein
LLFYEYGYSYAWMVLLLLLYLLGYNTTAGGGPNIWAKNPRKIWLSGNGPFQNKIAERFTKEMAEKIQNVIVKTRFNHALSVGATVFTICSKHWGF